MGGKVFCILSVTPQNGSKYIATNLGYQLRRINKNFKKKKVLLIDFDFESPVLCSHFIKDRPYSGIDNLLPNASQMDSFHA